MNDPPPADPYLQQIERDRLLKKVDQYERYVAALAADPEFRCSIGTFEEYSQQPRDHPQLEYPTQL